MRPSLGKLAVLIPSVAVLGACGGGPTGSARWVGKTYLLDTPNIPPGNWIAPPGIGGDIGLYVPQFLLGVADGAGGDLTITVGTAFGGVQDSCTQTVEVSASPTSYPHLQIVVPALPLRIVDPNDATVVVGTTIHDLTFTNVIPADSPAKDGEVLTTIDMAEVYPLVTAVSNPTKDSACSAAGAAGSPCDVCSFNAQPYCLVFNAVQIGAVQSPTAVMAISATDVPASCGT